jgi:hypothetical protein
MLAFEEKDRISWKEVFDCELLNPKKENLEATLKQSMQMAEKMCKSTLNMSRTVNKMYFEEHKVVTLFINAGSPNDRLCCRFEENGCRVSDS